MLDKIGDASDLKHHSLAGAMTGLVEYSLVYPIDFIKTRMQVLKPQREAAYPSVRSAISGIFKEGGMSRFFRGMSAPFLASIPSHAAYYAVYEQSKRKLSGTEGGYNSSVAQGMAGVLAVVSHNLIQNPADVIKQRMQVYDSPFRTTRQCFRHVLMMQGPKAFYRSLPTQLAIDAPYGAVHFVVYEWCQNLLNPARTFDAWSHVLGGALAGGVAAAVTNPLDVCRTLINVQEPAVLKESGQSLIRGLASAAKLVNDTWGLVGFARGLTPRVMFHVPKYALCWITYEFFKRLLVGNDNRFEE